MHQEHEEIGVGTGDGDNVAGHGNGALFIKRHIDGVRGGDLEQRVAVGGRARDRLQRKIAAGTRPVVDDHRLAEPLRYHLTHEPSDDIGRGAGGNEDEQAHWPCWIACALAMRDAAGNAAVPAARCKNLRRGQVSWCSSLNAGDMTLYILLRCMRPELARRVISLLRSNLVASGVKQTSIAEPGFMMGWTPRHGIDVPKWSV